VEQSSHNENIEEGTYTSRINHPVSRLILKSFYLSRLFIPSQGKMSLYDRITEKRPSQSDTMARIVYNILANEGII